MMKGKGAHLNEREEHGSTMRMVSEM